MYTIILKSLCHTAVVSYRDGSKKASPASDKKAHIADKKAPTIVKNASANNVTKASAEDIEIVRSDVASSLGKSDADKKALIEERAKMVHQIFTEKDPRFRATMQMKPAPSTGNGPGLYAGIEHNPTCGFRSRPFHHVNVLIFIYAGTHRSRNDARRNSVHRSWQPSRILSNLP